MIGPTKPPTKPIPPITNAPARMLPINPPGTESLRRQQNRATIAAQTNAASTPVPLGKRSAPKTSQKAMTKKNVATAANVEYTIWIDFMYSLTCNCQPMAVFFVFSMLAPP